MPDGAALVETHTSVVTFIGDRAYKLKKPVNLGFLDFRSRQARLAACLAEVTLNRRIAPDVYLGVLDVSDAEGLVCDHLVLMRRMPAVRRLSTLVLDHQDVAADLVEIARIIAGFHTRCATSAAIEAVGSPDALHGLWQEGLDELAHHSHLVAADQAAEIGALAMRYLEGRAPLFAERQRQGMIRDGHGDLQAGDIFCLPDGPRILDCLEFDEHLRYGDVLADVAFLAMDLERLGHADLGSSFLGAYATFSGERHPASLQDFYIAYRAFVRCKVACLRSAQGAADSAAEAGALATITVEHLRAARIRLVIVGGLPGTGKSTVAAAITAERDGWLLLRSDEVRGRAGDRYDDSPRNAVYDELLARTADALGHGQSVVIDASWSASAWREQASELARDYRADLIELNCTAPRQVAVARITARLAEGIDASEATIEVRDAMARCWPGWPGATELPTDATIETVLTRARLRLDAPSPVAEAPASRRG